MYSRSIPRAHMTLLMNHPEDSTTSCDHPDDEPVSPLPDQAALRSGVLFMRAAKASLQLSENRMIAMKIFFMFVYTFTSKCRLT